METVPDKENNRDGDDDDEDAMAVSQRIQEYQKQHLLLFGREQQGDGGCPDPRDTSAAGIEVPKVVDGVVGKSDVTVQSSLSGNSSGKRALKEKTSYEVQIDTWVWTSLFRDVKMYNKDLQLSMIVQPAKSS